jgi:flavodoxin
MKILIAYHSDTGNTEKVGKAIKEALDGEGQDVTAMAAKEVDSSTLGSYDLVVLGSGIYGQAYGKSAQNLIKNATSFPPKMAFFATHMEDHYYPKALKRIKKTLEDNNCVVVGELDIVGEDIGISDALKQKMLGTMTQEQRDERIKYFEAIKGRPNADDLAKAKEFAKSLLK